MAAGDHREKRPGLVHEGADAVAVGGDVHENGGGGFAGEGGSLDGGAHGHDEVRVDFVAGGFAEPGFDDVLDEGVRVAPPTRRILST